MQLQQFLNVSGDKIVKMRGLEGTGRVFRDIEVTRSHLMLQLPSDTAL